jgi:biopolymer transport protein ExbD
MLPKWLAGLLLLLAACGGARSESASPPKVAPPDATPGPDVSAVERCAEGWRQIADGAGGPMIVEACAGLYRREPCRTAFARATDPPGEGLRTALLDALLGACRDSYCRDLPAPVPSACAEGAPLPDRQAAAHELDGAILAHELAIDRDQAAKVSLFGQVVRTRDVAVTLPKSANAPATKTVDISVAKTKRGVKVTQGDGTWTLRRATAREHFAPVVSSLGPPDSDTQILLAVDAQIPYATVVALIDALKTAGFVKFALAVGERAD